MKKFFYFSITLICCVVIGFAFTSCGDDDEPIITNDFSTTELTTPMFLFEQPKSGVVSTIANGFSFWTFTDNKAAYGTFGFSGTRAILKCTELYDSWSLSNGKLVFGNINYGISRVNVLGVKAYTINLTAYIPSNLSVAGFKGETVFTNMNIDKTKLWNGLEKAKQEGQPVYIDEL